VAELLLYVDGQGYLHDFPVAISVLEEHVPREKFTVALRQLLARCLKRPTWTENWLVLIDALISLGLKREVQRAALAAETARVARSMSDFEVQCRVGDVLIQVGDIANATRVYRRIIGFTEDQNELSKVRRALEQLGDAEGAAQANKKWREIEDERDRKRQWEAEAAEREARSRCPRCGGCGHVWAAYDEIDSWDYVQNRMGRPRRIGVTRVREVCPVCGGSGRR